MAVSEQTPYIEYVSNGTTTSFALEFDCEKKDHLIVLVDDIEPVVGTWSLSNGAVVFNTAPENGKNITIQRNTPFSRNTDYQSYNNSFRPQSVNGDFDRVWLKLQELGVTDWLLRLYIDRLHGEQKTYIDQKDTQLQNNINSLSTHVDQQDAQLQQNIDNLKTYVDDRDDELRAYLMEEIRKQGVALDQLDEYYNYLMQRLAQIAVDKGWEASFVVDASGKNQQEINDAVAGRLLSSFGAVPDNPSSAIANREALLTASLSGPVIVDGYYDIDVTGSTNDFVTSLHWVAARTGGQLNFKGPIDGFLRFGSVDHVIVDKVRITSDNQTGVLMRILNDTVVINKLQFTCEINTGIGVFRGTWTNSIDPKVQYYGIKEANFNGAKLTNTNTAFMLINCPCDFFDIRNVNIRNMSFVPFNLGIDNRHLFTDSVRDLQKLLNADGLIAINDDDFWASGSDGNYFAVCMFEGSHAKRSNTYVEGLKTTYKMSTYDFYLNCKSLEADNVYWKNNVCFNSGKTNNELMKAKGTPDSTFTNGKFIVEKDFVLRHATDVQSQGWVTLFEKTSGNDKSKHVMNNSVIDVYMLLGMSSATQTKSIEMLDNNIHAEIFASYFLNISNNKASDITTHADAEIVFKGNTIKFDKIDTIIRDGATHSVGMLLRMNYTPELDTYRKITSENEVLIGEVSSGIFQMHAGLAAGELALKDSVHINNCPIENNNRLFWGSSFISTERPAIMRQTAVSVPPVFNGALFTTLNLMRGGEQEFNLSIPYRDLSTYIRGPVLAKKTIVVELSAAQGGVTYSAAYKLILETDGYTYQSAEDVYTKYPYPTVYTAVTPIISKIDAFDELMAGVTFGVGTSVEQLIRIRYEFSQAALSSLIDYKIKIKIV